MHEDLRHPLGVQREHSDGHVTMLRGLHQVTVRLNLVEGQEIVPPEAAGTVELKTYDDDLLTEGARS